VATRPGGSPPLSYATAPPRTGMLVANDMRYDSRVQREAATVAAAGYQVTVYCVLSAATSARVVERLDGYSIVRIPVFGAGRAGLNPRTGPGSDGTGIGLRLAFHRLALAAFQATRSIPGGAVHLGPNRWVACGRWRSRG